jgi:hypothetical protein
MRVLNEMPSKYKSKAKSLVKELNIHNIYSDKKYNLVKVPHPGDLGGETKIDHAQPFVCGNEDCIWLVMLSFGSWYKTSPIRKYNPKTKVFTTENSYYKLEEA